jgi:hypothetical protein
MAWLKIDANQYNIQMCLPPRVLVNLPPKW